MMRFKPVATPPDWPRLEREVLAWWHDTEAFGKLTRLRAGGPSWSFQDGPITANNPMGVHHAWGRTYKDVWQRYKAMQGFDQRWQNGFDCQGLWVEVEVEKELGFTSKRDIEQYGVQAFVRRCKQRVLRYAALQTEQSIRLGMWMHWDDPERLRRLADSLDDEAPVTFDTPEGPVTATAEWLVGRLGHRPWNGSYFTLADLNNDLIWGFLARCHAHGWITQGTDVMPWCTRCGTGLSHHEIATEGYREVTHRSPILRFPLVDRPGESLLVWTTTPWTLTSNVAAAVGPQLTYLRVRLGDEVVYLAEGAAAHLGLAPTPATPPAPVNPKSRIPNPKSPPALIEARLTGTDLLGWRYHGPFDELPAQHAAREHHRVIPWEAVGAEEGTGIVHIAPGCGAEDFALAKVHDLPAIAPLDEDGRFLDAGFDWLAGRHALEVADDIIASLEAKRLLFRAAAYTHRYPVCWRCGSELVFRLVEEWFISMGPSYDKPRAEVTPAEKAASLRYQIMDVVDQIRWIPPFGRERELDWLRNMQDWMISKKRYWGLALPIWRCTDCGWFDVIGSREELERRAVAGWASFDGHSPHRPFIDAVTIRCGGCGGQARRIPEVGNPWLDAGIVPFSTLPDPQGLEERARWFPADFITESFPGQFRNWFYSLLAMGTVLAQTAPFKTVLGYATLFAEDGREMHKSWGNMIEFNEAADEMGVDVMRWMYLAHRPEQNLFFGYGPGKEVRRRFLIPLWNVYAFFVQYANVATDWRPSPPHPRSREAGEAERSEVAWGREAQSLDRWIRARLNQVVAEATVAMDDFDACRATVALEAFLEDLSNWYVRRSRRRFWEGEPAALETLYAVLETLTRLLAPFIPFTAEAIYQNLVRTVQPGAPESVHHSRWPEAVGSSPEEERLLADMGLVLRLAALGRSARAASGIKLRQPLARATVAVRTPEEERAVTHLGPHLREELNVKRLDVVRDESALVSYALRPVLPRLGPAYGAKVPAIREALRQADAAAVAAQVAAGRPVALTVDGQALELAPEDIEVMAVPREDLATAEEDGTVVAISTELTDELLAEGVARDLVRAVQQLRKDAGLEITDRIHLALDVPSGVAAAVEAWHDYVTGETLATRLSFGPPDGDMVVTTVDIDDQSVTIGLRKGE
jgi:isoleucyl-tRNA synthetase